MTTQPEALRLADELESWILGKPAHHREAAAELRRLHELNVDKTEIIASLCAMNRELLDTLKLAEAGLADIGDADREPGDDLAWCERRAAEPLPIVRAVIRKAE